MGGYLEEYGTGEEKRNRIIVTSVVSVLVVALLGALGWYLTQNHKQEALVKHFLAAIRQGDLAGAYRIWGCTAQSPCKGYGFDKFQEDWGKTKNNPPDPALLSISDSEGCKSGVLLTVRVNASREEKLWVDKAQASISFAPYPQCPHQTPYEIMLHRTLGQLRKPLLK